MIVHSPLISSWIPPSIPFVRFHALSVAGTVNTTSAAWDSLPPESQQLRRLEGIYGGGEKHSIGLTETG
jgi:hypothetical protein